MRYLTLLAASTVVSLTAQAGEVIDYSVNGEAYEGYLAEATRESKGLVVIIHDWGGLDDYEKTRAEMIADAGYDAFAIDLYGAGNRPDTTEARKEQVGKLYNNRELMRARILGGIEQAREASGESDVIVMGYCFGGGATLELARSGEGEDIAGFATFHGSLDAPEGADYSATSAPVLIMHGGADTGIPNALAANTADMLEKAGATYEVQIYSGAPHAWTVFGSDRYQALADEQSWDAFMDFTDRYLGDTES
ncbi:dienelactone hydrolase family protein [Henriciella litoralis]|uniref:dienelactone hydrolase family protein n=1 Tax=Henriciella litoralis TaxID=568102 RepID=UPI000A0501FD|nr:dienelactone hydrolase family protein [Henriciella litoralis]